MSQDGQLRKALGPVMLWGLGVGYVISGEYFGWNLGLPAGGSYGMLIATLLVTVMYVSFVFSYTELACAIPRAGGAFVYCARAYGPLGGALGGLAQLIEFVFAPPAIAMAIAAYVGQRFEGLPVEGVAIAAYIGFTALNAWGVKQAVIFELVVTVLAVLELLLFVGLTLPHFEWQAFSRNPLPHGTLGVFECLPFAIWFYLAIEGVANAAEEARDPQRDVPRGFGSAMLTLVGLALLVFFSATGVAGWSAIVTDPLTGEPSDAPLPLALSHVVGRDSVMYTLLLGVGLLGLVASFHGILLAAARATFEFGRSGYLPAVVGRIHRPTGTPRMALLINLLAGIVAILSGRTGEIITLACFGALSLYVLTMGALLRLRHREPELARPYRALGYPYLAVTALGIAAVCLIAMVWTQPRIALVFAGAIALGLGYYTLAVRRRPQTPG